MIRLAYLMIWPTKQARNCNYCLTRYKSPYYHWSNVPPQLCAPRHGGRGGKNNGPVFYLSFLSCYPGELCSFGIKKLSYLPIFCFVFWEKNCSAHCFSDGLPFLLRNQSTVNISGAKIAFRCLWKSVLTSHCPLAHLRTCVESIKVCTVWFICGCELWWGVFLSNLT